MVLPGEHKRLFWQSSAAGCREAGWYLARAWISSLSSCSPWQNAPKAGDFTGAFEMLFRKRHLAKLSLLLLKLVAKLSQMGENRTGLALSCTWSQPGLFFQKHFLRNLDLSSEAVNYSSPGWNKMLSGQRDKGQWSDRNGRSSHRAMEMSTLLQKGWEKPSFSFHEKHGEERERAAAFLSSIILHLTYELALVWAERKAGG